MKRNRRLRTLAVVPLVLPGSALAHATAPDVPRFLTGANEGSPREIALAYLDRNGAALHVTSAELREAAVTDEGEMLDKIDYVTHDRWGAAGGAAWASDALSPGGAESVASTGAYNVFAVPMESPYDGGRTLEVDLADALASPFGWHDTDGADGAEFMTTQGNNVHAYTDFDANNIPEPGSSPDGGGDLVFDFPLDLAQEPATYQPAAVANLFYWNNVLHDVFYRYGLTGYHVAFDARTWPEWFGCSRSP